MCFTNLNPQSIFCSRHTAYRRFYLWVDRGGFRFSFFLVSALLVSCSEARTRQVFGFLTSETQMPALDSSFLQRKAREAKSYCRKHQLNTSWCLLADMSRHSGLPRLIVWDFKQNAILRATLVGHGCGPRHPWNTDHSKTNPQFSNEVDSHCSSLGHYRIGSRGPSSWGIRIKYLLHGLDSSNSNALKRVVVLHGWDRMADEATYPAGSPEGWGCPTVSNKTMHWLDERLQKEKIPVLLWMF